MGTQLYNPGYWQPQIPQTSAEVGFLDIKIKGLGWPLVSFKIK